MTDSREGLFLIRLVGFRSSLQPDNLSEGIMQRRTESDIWEKHWSDSTAWSWFFINAWFSLEFLLSLEERLMRGWFSWWTRLPQIMMKKNITKTHMCCSFIPKLQHSYLCHWFNLLFHPVSQCSHSPFSFKKKKKNLNYVLYWCENSARWILFSSVLADGLMDVLCMNGRGGASCQS